MTGSPEYRPMIGLEIHVALATRSKMFCGCSTEFGAPPNTNVCPVCLGLPGSLPVINARALELGIMCARAVGGQVQARMHFERKNYHYPDLPKGYQISQYAVPLAIGGEVVLDDVEDAERRVRIRRVHLEEDAGKSTHSAETGHTLLDFNRCGVPLAEIVTEPDIRSPGEARAFLEELRALLRVAGVSEVRMEAGELRCDVNFNLVRSAGGDGLEGTEISEVKNLNSFRSVQRALEYEVSRHREAIRGGEPLVHETRHWDEERGITYAARSKEEAHDYRYFPEPDLPPISVEPDLAQYLAAQVPELPRARRRRFRNEFDLGSYDARALVSEAELADFFEEAVAEGADPKDAANWILGEVRGHLNATGDSLADLPVTPRMLAALLSLVAAGEISGTMAKDVWSEAVETGRDPVSSVEESGLRQISDEETLDALVEEVIEENPDAAEEFTAGKEKALGFLVGQVMKKTRGQANPQLANERLRKALRNGSDHR